MKEIPVQRRHAGEIRIDGFIFKGYRTVGENVYEHWHSPEGLKAITAYKRQWERNNREAVKLDPVRLAASRECARAHQHKIRRSKPEQQMLIRARQRAKEKGLEFDLEQSDVCIPNVCPVLNIPIQVSDGYATDNSPELDRVNNTKGYVKGNVIVISRRANRIKNNATAAELMQIAKFYTRLERRKK